MMDVVAEGKKAVEEISRKVQGLYFKLRCGSLDERRIQNDSPQKGHRASFLPTLMDGQGVSERNILNSMEVIEKRSNQVIAEYIKHLQKKSRGRRQTLKQMNASMFERAKSMFHSRASVKEEKQGLSLSRALSIADMSDDTDTDGDSTSTDSDSFDNAIGDGDDEKISKRKPSRRPLSVDEMRRQAKQRHTQTMHF